MKQDILFAGNHESIRSMYPHLDETAIQDFIKKSHQERIEQAERDAEIEAAKINKLKELGVDIESDKEVKVKGAAPTTDPKGSGDTQGPKPKIDNPIKHSEQSSIQPGRNGDGRKSDKTKRAEKQSRKESGFEED
jgi:hypothetical protein